jgi:glutamate dehydrogenase
MFLIISSEFRGFHLRFRDIARGGIRIVKSRNNERALMLYASPFRLLTIRIPPRAISRKRRWKPDIPEGGAKGVILLDADHQDKARVAFEKYIDSILELPPGSATAASVLSGPVDKLSSVLVGAHEEDLVLAVCQGCYPLGC